VCFVWVAGFWSLRWAQHRLPARSIADPYKRNTDDRVCGYDQFKLAFSSEIAYPIDMKQTPKSYSYALGYCESTLQNILRDMERGILKYAPDSVGLPISSQEHVKETLEIAANAVPDSVAKGY